MSERISAKLGFEPSLTLALRDLAQERRQQGLPVYDFGLGETKRDLLFVEAKALPHVEVWPTPASFYSFWDVRDCFGKRTPDAKTLTCSNEVAEYLLTAAGVVTLSGEAFLQDGYLRFIVTLDSNQKLKLTFM